MDEHVIGDVVTSHDCTAYSNDQPTDHRPLREVLSELVSDRGGQIARPDVVHWLHGTRVISPDTFLTHGLQSLQQRIELIWEDLFRLAEGWLNRREWQKFRMHVETTDASMSSVRYRLRLNNAADGGPHAVLIRDAIVKHERFGGVDYLSAPETIQDLCESFKTHHHRDLLSKFQAESVPCIVKIHDPRPSGNLVGVALSYLWCSFHGEHCGTCNICYEAHGILIPPSSIVEIQKWHDGV